MRDGVSARSVGRSAAGGRSTRGVYHVDAGRFTGRTKVHGRRAQSPENQRVSSPRRNALFLHAACRDDAVMHARTVGLVVGATALATAAGWISAWGCGGASSTSSGGPHGDGGGADS